MSKQAATQASVDAFIASHTGSAGGGEGPSVASHANFQRGQSAAVHAVPSNGLQGPLGTAKDTQGRPVALKDINSDTLMTVSGHTASVANLMAAGLVEQGRDGSYLFHNLDRGDPVRTGADAAAAWSAPSDLKAGMHQVDQVAQRLGMQSHELAASMVTGDDALSKLMNKAIDAKLDVATLEKGMAGIQTVLAREAGRICEQVGVSLHQLRNAGNISKSEKVAAQIALMHGDGSGIAHLAGKLADQGLVSTANVKLVPGAKLATTQVRGKQVEVVDIGGGMQLSKEQYRQALSDGRLSAWMAARGTSPTDRRQTRRVGNYPGMGGWL